MNRTLAEVDSRGRISEVVRKINPQDTIRIPFHCSIERGIFFENLLLSVQTDFLLQRIDLLLRGCRTAKELA